MTLHKRSAAVLAFLGFCLSVALSSHANVNVNIATHAAVGATKRAPRAVRLMPIHAAQKHLEYLQDYYKEHLGLSVELLPALVPDRSAWTEDRQQWSGEGLAEQVRQAAGNDEALVIGITGEDMYLRTVNWQFAFGWRAHNRIAVVSYARMDPRFLGQSEAIDVLQRRLRRMVTKNLGLLLYGLRPSADPTSPVYRDILGLEELDAMQDDLAAAGFPVRSGLPR
jgi:predicted Zn-dependent protease